MKVLFIGVGLTHYSNQILNKLSGEPDISIFNLVDSRGVGHVSNTVYQTKDDVKFTIVYLPQVLRKKYSDNNYNSFIGFQEKLSELRPDIIVVAEIYFKMFLVEPDIISKISELGIKIIMKDIPFLMDTLEETKRKILSGESDSAYVPFFVPYFLVLCNKLKIGKFPTLIEKAMSKIGLIQLYRKFIGRKILLQRLEIKKQAFNSAHAHVDYIEDAYRLFGSFGVPREKIFIIYNSPDTDHLFKIREKIEKEPLPIAYSPHRLIHVGRLVPWKRVDMLIRSFFEIQQEFKDAELLIIGFGPIENELKDLAKELNLGQSVKFLGGVYKPEDLGRYMMSSAIYVLAGMGGLSINDAMAFGMPVICSVCDGTEKKLVYDGKNGLYFKDGDLKDLTEKIMSLLGNVELMKKMGQYSTNIIKNDINIHTVIKGYLQAFNYVLRLPPKKDEKI